MHRTLPMEDTMCRAAPMKVIAINEMANTATVDLDGIRKEISLALLDGVSVGDYVIVHTGFALQNLDIDKTEESLALLRAVSRESVPAAFSLG